MASTTRRDSNGCLVPALIALFLLAFLAACIILSLA